MSVTWILYGDKQLRQDVSLLSLSFQFYKIKIIIPPLQGSGEDPNR